MSGEERGAKRIALGADMLPGFRDELQASLLTAMSSALGAGLDRMSAKLEHSLEVYDKGVQSQFASQQQQITAIAQRLEMASASIGELTRVIQRLDNSMAAVESQTPIRVDSDGFDRSPDPTIVRVRTTDKVAKDKLLQAPQEVFDEMRLPAGQAVLTIFTRKTGNSSGLLDFLVRGHVSLHILY